MPPHRRMHLIEHRPLTRSRNTSQKESPHSKSKQLVTKKKLLANWKLAPRPDFVKRNFVAAMNYHILKPSGSGMRTPAPLAVQNKSLS
jgi:hypothetical protein